MVTTRTTPENEAAKDLIEEYRKKSCAIITFCDLDNIPPFHRIEVLAVQIPKGDVYKPSQSKGFTPHFRALEHLGNLIGVQWVSKETKMTLVPGVYVQYDAVGFYLRQDGEPVSEKGIGVKIYQDERELLQATFERKARSEKKSAEWVTAKTTEAFYNDRKKYPQKAAAEAKGQVLRKLLRLSGAYEKKMFDNPIVLVRCKLVPDYSDPEIAHRTQLKALSASTSLYGDPGGQRLLPSPGEMPAGIELRTPDATSHIPDGMQVAEDPEEKELTREGFIDADDERQIQEIEGLAKDVDYTPTMDIRKISRERRIELYDHLMTDGDAYDGVDDDEIPF